jgi:hypothetical protein
MGRPPALAVRSVKLAGNDVHDVIATDSPRMTKGHQLCADGLSASRLGAQKRQSRQGSVLAGEARCSGRFSAKLMRAGDP